MKVTVLFRGARYLITIRNEDTIGDVKSMFIKRFGLDMCCGTENLEHLEVIVYYYGCPLKDALILNDFIVPGSAIRLVVQRKARMFLRLVAPLPLNGLDLTEPIDAATMTVGELRTVIQGRTSLPVSVFRLLTVQGVCMYDSHTLKDYGIEEGDSLQLQVWDGSTRVIESAMSGDVTQTMKHIVSFHTDPMLNRYYLRVSLHLAAWHGHSQLTLQLLQAGARSDDPIGEHPCRDWIGRLRHPGTYDTPVHVAAQSGNIAVLQILVHHNVGSIIARNHAGETPATVARKYNRKICFKFLVAQQLKGQKFGELTLNQYAKVRRWLARARDRLAYYRCDSDKLLLVGRSIANGSGPVVGSMIQVDGFGNDVQSSVATLNKTKLDRKAQWLWLRSLQNQEGLEFPSLYSVCYPHEDFPENQTLQKKRRGYVAETGNELEKQQESVFLTQPSEELSQAAKNFDPVGFTPNTEKESQKSAISVSNTSLLFTLTQRNLSALANQLQRRKSETESSTESRKSNSPESASQWSEIIAEKRATNLTSSGRKKLALAYHIRSKSYPTVSPDLKRNRFSRYFCDQTDTDQMVSIITGVSSHEFARQSFEVGSTFKSLSWLKQLQIAMNYNKNTILRGLKKGITD